MYGYVFSGCTSLTSIVIPESLTVISNAFNGCSSLTNVTMHNRVTEIQAMAFKGCSSLTSITIPNSVTYIGCEAFANCDNLTSIYCKATTPPAMYYYYTFYPAFYQYPLPRNSNMKIYVPRNSYNDYMQYSDFANQETSPQNWYIYESYIEPYDFE